MKSQLNIEKQNEVTVKLEALRKVLGKMRNWKSPGPDLVQGLWLKNFRSLHGIVAKQLQACIDDGFLPS